LAGIVPHQSAKRGQNPEKTIAESRQPRRYGPPQRSHHFAASQSYLGAQYRRLRTRLGAPKAITAMARKLACLFYRLIKHGQQYVDKGNQY
jgi:hypothetical protein